MDDIKPGDLVSCASPGNIHDSKLFMVIAKSQYGFTLMEYNSIEDFTQWYKRNSKIHHCLASSVRKDLFQTQLMQAQLHDWFLSKKEVGSGE